MEDKSAGKKVEKKNKKSLEKESVSAMRTVERSGGKGRKMRRGEREREGGKEDCGARYCEFVTELLSSPLLVVPSCVTSASPPAGPSE